MMRRVALSRGMMVRMPRRGPNRSVRMLDALRRLRVCHGSMALHGEMAMVPLFGAVSWADGS